MGHVEFYKPIIVMIVMQFTYGAVSIITRASLLEGMNPRVFVFYRQAFATLVIAPVAYFSRSKITSCRIGWKSFWLIFLASLIGITTSQMIFLEGLYLASASAGSAIFNLVPAITFVVASIVGYEPINIRSLRTMAKIFGTIVCVTSAAAMALIKGPKLLNANLPSSNSLLLNSTEVNNLWLWGCLCLFGSSCCWSFWLIIQVYKGYIVNILILQEMRRKLSLQHFADKNDFVEKLSYKNFSDKSFDNLRQIRISSKIPRKTCQYFIGIPTLFFLKHVRWNLQQVPVTKSYPDHLSLSAWMCFMATVQSGIVLLFTDPHLEAWKITSYFQMGSLLYAAIVGSGISIFAQSWIIQKRGPVFSAIAVGAVGIVIGLYVVLWGKAKDLEEMKEQQEKKTMLSQKDQIDVVRIMVDEANLEEPLLPKQTNKF
ncbi:putative EamA domain-containing protein [Helianthus annuus]|nr:putative EamA domain-containing protein [Helianthus annuus]